MTLNYPRDYRVVDTNTISLNTLDGRKKVTFQVGKYQQHYLNIDEWEIRSANLMERRRDGKIFLNIAIEKELPDIPLSQCDGIIGIDLGINFVAVTTNTLNRTSFYGGGRMKYTRWKYQTVRQTLQQKGTRSAKKRLKRISGREKRFIADKNHCISKQIVKHAKETFQYPLIVLEDLTNIRINPRKSKKTNRLLNNWSYSQLQMFIEYKAAEQGIPVVCVDPAYTSQMCPQCGHTEKANRNKKLHTFQCKKCGYQSNDDRVASMNIRDRGVMNRYIRSVRGICQLPHDVAEPPVLVTSS